MARNNVLLLDLDGTLLDTAPNLAKALNQTLKDAGRPELPTLKIRPHVSHGAKALVRFGFNMDERHPDFEHHRQRLLAHYLDDLHSETNLFPGMERVLDKLEKHGLKWGVVTNKPSRFTDPLMSALGLADRSSVTISGDTLEVSKPDPAPLLHACDLIGAAPEECIYVGDAERDVEAGKRAGMATLVARFGYIDDSLDIDSWKADGYIDGAEEILDWMSIDK